MVIKAVKSMIAKSVGAVVSMSAVDFDKKLTGLINELNETVMPVIRDHLNHSDEEVLGAVKTFKKCRQSLEDSKGNILTATTSKCKIIDDKLERLRILFEDAIRSGILEWYHLKFQTHMKSSEPVVKREDQVARMLNVVIEANGLLREAKYKWHPVFLHLEAGVGLYLETVYDELQKSLIKDLEFVCTRVITGYDTNKKLRTTLEKKNKEERSFCKILMGLFNQTKLFVNAKDSIFVGDQPDEYITQVDHYYGWFRPILVLWLGFALIEGTEMIHKSIYIDTIETVRYHGHLIKESTSAIDTVGVFYHLMYFWDQLEWPDVEESFVLLYFLAEVICSYTVLYAKLKHEKLTKEGYFTTKDEFDISERLCIVFNNIEYVEEYMLKILEQKLYPKLALLESNEECGVCSESVVYRKRIGTLISGSSAVVEMRFTDMIQHIKGKIAPQIRQKIIECYTKLPNLPSTHLEEALYPLFDFLENDLTVLKEFLRDMSFARILTMFWNITCDEMVLVTEYSQGKTEQDQVNFYRRVLQLYPFIQDYFHGSGNGITKEEMSSAHYESSFQAINFFTLSTQSLIHQYHPFLANEHLAIEPINAKLGTIRIDISFFDGRLDVNVISASNLIPSDHFSKQRWYTRWCCCRCSSDPFVEVHLEPADAFPFQLTQRTEVKWNTLNPEWNEKMYWDVSKEDCLKPDSTIVFSVKDYDTVTHDDFLGQVVLFLSSVPGVTSVLLRRDSTVESVNHILHSTNENNPILRVLSSRPWDEEAKAFANDQLNKVLKLKK